jgi:hypothetical protein
LKEKLLKASDIMAGIKLIFDWAFQITTIKKNAYI